MAQLKILITPRSLTRGGHAALTPLVEAGFELVFCSAGVQPGEAELLRLLPGCVGYLAGVEKISGAVLQAATGLKVITRNGVGIDNVDLAAAKTLGIAVLPAAGANARGVAELAIALMLALVRAIPFSDAAMKNSQWSRREGIELAGRTIGVVGCGRIGQLVARMAAGLDMQPIGFDPIATAVPCNAFRYVSFEQLLGRSDIITLHCPAPADGQAVITRATLSRIKPGAYLVNTARASLLDVPAVLEALDSGKLAGLATDVFEAEPPGDDPLVRHTKVIATPHVGGFTAESVSRAVSAAVENLLKVLKPTHSLTRGTL
jgi:phosphoglycerate dehydrogenase-like enzyme